MAGAGDGTRRAAFAVLAVLSMGTGITAALPLGAAQASPVASSTASAASAVTRIVGGHSLAVQRSPGATTTPAAGLRALATIGTPVPTLPAAVDLTRYDEKVGDQGQVGSCAAWAIGYGMMGWFARSQGHAGAPYAPMYGYSQVDGGNDGGSSPAAVLEVLRTQGIDTAAHYAQKHAQSVFDWRHLPSAAERTSAAANKITGWISLYNTLGAPGPSAVTAVKTALASGRPVALAIGVYQRFLDADKAASLVTSNAKLGSLLGFHEVLAVGYDSLGVHIENSWGTGWGSNGYAILDWNYLAQHSYEAETIAGLSTTTGANRPVVSSVSPALGTFRGGQTVTVTGSRLGSSIVSIGARSVSPLTISTDGRRLTFKAPAGIVGAAPLRLSTPLGVSIGGPATYHYTF